MSDFEVISWRRKNQLWLIVYRILCVASLGFLPLFCFYFPVYFEILTSVASDPGSADWIVVKSEGKSLALPVNPWESSRSEASPILSIELDCVRYFALREENYRFRKVRDVPRNFIRFLDMDYVSDHAPQEMIEEQAIIRLQYGLNVMKIPESSFFEIAVRHMLSPFYLFQYFAAAVWYAEDYWLYATLILIITVAAIYVTTRETIENLQSLRMLAGSDSTVQALAAETERTTFDLDQHGRDIQLISDRQLLPGRKFKLTENMTLPCDAVLISGKVVMDESMLTGESVPVSKVPIDANEIAGDKTYVLSIDRLALKSQKLQKQSQKRSKRAAAELLLSDGEHDDGDERNDDDLEQTFLDNAALRPPNLLEDNELAIKRSGSVLFGGTRVKACYGSECIAVVYRTGFRSAKGMLVASLLKPKEGFINFVSDALWVLLFMVILSTAMYCAVCVRIVELGATPMAVFYHYLDTITIAVPPALTACLTVATAISIGRLKKRSIFVSDTSRVNFAGVVNAVCFDKTGTLTEDKLTFVGYQTPVISSRTGVSMDDWMDFSRDNHEILPLRCQEIMATCHALSLFGFDDALTPVGDPLEVELLNASGWDLRASATVPGQLIACPPVDRFELEGEVLPDEEYKILKHFEFTPDRLRAASIVQEPSGHMMYLMKGSPEVILKLCSPSTVPHSIHTTMAKLTKRGYRVIAVAYRDLKTKSTEAVLAMTQDECEVETATGAQHTVFAGLLYLSNELKAASRRTIRGLHRAQLHTNMITGDHVYTAIAVAQQCRIIAPEGKPSSVSPAGTVSRALPPPPPPPQPQPSASQQTPPPPPPKFVLIIDENEVIRGELCIKDYDSGALVDIDVHRCAVMAAKTVYHTILRRYRQQHQRSVAGATGSSNAVAAASTAVRMDDSDDATTDTERMRLSDGATATATATAAATAAATKNKNRLSLSRLRQNQSRRAKASDSSRQRAAVVRNPLQSSAADDYETHTPFASRVYDEEDSAPPSPAASSSLNSSRVDISLMSFGGGGGAVNTSGGSSIRLGALSSFTSHQNNNHSNSNNANAALNNSSVHSVRSTTSTKSGHSHSHSHSHCHSGSFHTSNAQPSSTSSSTSQAPFSLLHHNRHLTTAAATAANTAASVGANSSSNSPSTSRQSTQPLRQAMGAATTTAAAAAAATSSSLSLLNQSSLDSPTHPLPPPSESSLPSPILPPSVAAPSLVKPFVLQIPRRAHVELAITGKALHLIRQQYSYTLYQKLIRYARVFARMKPHDKREVVETMLDTLEYRQFDMSWKRLYDDDGGGEEKEEEEGYSDRERGRTPSPAAVPWLLPTARTLFHENDVEMAAPSLDSHVDDDDNDQPGPSGDEDLSAGGGAGGGGIAGTAQDRRRRKASMLTTLNGPSTTAATATATATATVNPLHDTSSLVLGEDSEDVEAATSTMLYPALPHHHYERDLEAQDYPTLAAHHPHPHPHPHSHAPVLIDGSVSRARGLSLSTIATLQSQSSNRGDHSTSNSNNSGSSRGGGGGGGGGDHARSKRRTRGTRPTATTTATVAATLSSTEPFATLTRTWRHVYDYTTEQLAGAPPVAEPLEVLFCGDGANDMIALRAATVGISLCDAETSVAAPITSRQATPFAVVEVLREGRCSLITAYVLILFNIMYGTIQLFMVCALYFYGLIPGNYMYLQQDLCYTLVLGLAISYSLPSSTLHHMMPPKRFLSRRFLVQLCLLLVSFVVFQLLSLVLLTMQDFYTPYRARQAFTETYSYEASTTQAMALGQLMIASVVASLGEPFRLTWTRNAYHLYALAVQTIWLGFQIFAQENVLLQEILQIKPVPTSFGCLLVALLILNAVVAGNVVRYVDDEIAPMTSQRWFEVCAMKQRRVGQLRRLQQQQRRQRQQEQLAGVKASSKKSKKQQRQQQEQVSMASLSASKKKSSKGSTVLGVGSTRGNKYQRLAQGGGAAGTRLPNDGDDDDADDDEVEHGAARQHPSDRQRLLR